VETADLRNEPTIPFRINRHFRGTDPRRKAAPAPAGAGHTPERAETKSDNMSLALYAM
jgi:hypothetical protein